MSHGITLLSMEIASHQLVYGRQQLYVHPLGSVRGLGMAGVTDLPTLQRSSEPDTCACGQERQEIHEGNVSIETGP